MKVKLDKKDWGVIVEALDHLQVNCSQNFPSDYFESKRHKTLLLQQKVMKQLNDQNYRWDC